MAAKRKRSRLLHHGGHRFGEEQCQLSAWRVVVLAGLAADTEEHDIGPFKTKTLAFSGAEHLTAERRQSTN